MNIKSIYCIKDVYDNYSNKLSNKKGDFYTILSNPKQSDHILITTDKKTHYPWDCTLIQKSVLSTHFITKSEYRKEKIKKLLNGRVQKLSQ